MCAGSAYMSWLGQGLIGLGFLTALYAGSLYNYLVFHSLVELFSIVVAAAIFILAWNTRGLHHNSYLLFLGVAYLFVAGLDLVHTLAYKGMGVFPGGKSNLPTQLWIAARYMESCSLLAAPAFLTRRLKVPLTMAAFAALTALLLASIFSWRIFPDCFVQGKGLTQFKVISEYVISLVLVGAGAYTWSKRREFNPRVLGLMLASIFTTILSELALTFYIDSYGFSNLVGHFAKLISFYLVYRAIVVIGLREPYQLLFRDLKLREQELELAGAQLEDRVAQRTFQLQSALENLRKEFREREQAEEALKESEEKYRLVVENAAEAIFIAKGGKCLLTNSRAVEMTGYSMEQLSSLQLMDLIHPRDRGMVTARLEKTMAGQDAPSAYTVTLVNKQGLELSTQFSANPMVWQRHPAILVMIRDLSKIKKLETRVRQAQKMEAIGCLAGGVAHDFNNILGVIVGYSELAIENQSEGLSNRTELEHVLTAAKRATDLVKQLLSFSRQTEVERGPIDLTPIVRETTKLLRSSLPATIDISQNLSKKVGPVMADPTEVHQVLMNLCTNAFHAMRRQGGELALEMDQVELDEDLAARMVDLKPGLHVRLSVTDTGKGMDLQTLNRIFEPFFTTKAKGEGTGLGLSVVHGIVKSMKGAITVYSEPGQGTTFHVYLPALEPEASMQQQLEEIPLLRGDERILLVDDELHLLEANTRMLERLGYQVNSVSSGLEAHELFRSDPYAFDLLITDQTMAKMTGVELARQVLKRRPELPVIMCTGFSEQVSAENAAKAGVSRLLMKPLFLHQVARAIREVLEQPAEALRIRGSGAA